MIKNYFHIAFRNLLKNKVYSLINILGLAAGMGVAILIGLWIYDGLSYDKYHKNYDRLASVLVNQHFNNEVSTQHAQPFPLGEELKTKYANDFTNVSMASWSYGHFIGYKEDKLSKEGMFVEPQFIDMASLKMLKGSKNALNDPHSVILNESLAKTIFKNDEPVGKIINIDNLSTVTVTGIFEDIPYNSSFTSVQFLLPWQLYATDYGWVKNSKQNWGNFSYQAFVQLKPLANFENVSNKIRDVIIKNNPRTDSRPELFLHPMRKWHLYSEFENGVSAGGDIQYVWLFGMIGVFVLLLACINFMNLSTARSEKRAKEVGIRKSIGSLRHQLIIQFLSESFLYVILAFLISVFLVQLSLPWFNQLADKKITLPISNVYFWIAAITFIFFTSILAGSYPALYLSSFNPVKILKGTFKTGRYASVPRKALVVVQFSISILLIIGTVIVYRQILFAKNRPIGYDRESLITTYGYPFTDFSNNPKRYDFLKSELMNTGAIVNMAKCSSPTTGVYSNQSDFNWQGRDPNLMPNFGVIWCSHDYGKTIGLQFVQGRDFSREYATDTAAIVLNEAAVKFMGLKDPINQTIEYNHSAKLNVIGVVKDMLMESPYAGTRPVVFMINYSAADILSLKLNPQMSAREALSKIGPVFKNFSPKSLFEYQFTDEEFNKKFINEERIGSLAAWFAGLAIFISCLGLFGLASFVAEQRTKEIGVRKVLGASVFNVWKMLSKDFVVLVLLSCFIAIPIAWYYLNLWLRKYEYHAEISIWIFVATIAGALLITLLTVSFQAIKAALANPVKSLRTE